MNLTKRNILNIWRQLEACKGLKGAKFVYAVAKNRGKLRTEVEAIEAAGKPSEEFLAYENGRQELLRTLADTDSNGRPIMIGNTYLVRQFKADFDQAIATLKEKHADAISAHEAAIKEFDDLLNESVDVDLHVIKFADLPNDITVEQLDHLDWMVEEPE